MSSADEEYRRSASTSSFLDNTAFSYHAPLAKSLQDPERFQKILQDSARLFKFWVVLSTIDEGYLWSARTSSLLDGTAFFFHALLTKQVFSSELRFVAEASTALTSKAEFSFQGFMQIALQNIDCDG